MLQSPLAQRRAAKQNATTYQFVNLSLPSRSPLNSSQEISSNCGDPPLSMSGMPPAIGLAGGCAESEWRDSPPPL